jgi:hypothetical protein
VRRGQEAAKHCTQSLMMFLKFSSIIIRRIGSNRCRVLPNILLLYLLTRAQNTAYHINEPPCIYIYIYIYIGGWGECSLHAGNMLASWLAPQRASKSSKSFRSRSASSSGYRPWQWTIPRSMIRSSSRRRWISARSSDSIGSSALARLSSRVGVGARLRLRPRGRTPGLHACHPGAPGQGSWVLGAIA